MDAPIIINFIISRPECVCAAGNKIPPLNTKPWPERKKEADKFGSF